MIKMENIIPGTWLHPSSLQEATVLQREWALRVVKEDDFPLPQLIAGMDVSNNPRDPQQLIYATVVVLSVPSCEIIEIAHAIEKQPFPYIPGYLGFREFPALYTAYQKLNSKPDLLFVDGHGISHPRGLGIASHIGVLLNIPTIGVAKSLLVGKPATSLGDKPGDTTPIVWRNQVIAMQLRSKLRCNPLIVATGHRVSLQSAVSLVQTYLRGYRLPEPTRQAHLAANRFRQAI
jgi:deoxyribonuclease V